jgi:hypothetical protein
MQILRKSFEIAFQIIGQDFMPSFFHQHRFVECTILAIAFDKYIPPESIDLPCFPNDKFNSI